MDVACLSLHFLTTQHKLTYESQTGNGWDCIIKQAELKNNNNLIIHQSINQSIN